MNNRKFKAMVLVLFIFLGLDLIFASSKGDGALLFDFFQMKMKKVN